MAVTPFLLASAQDRLVVPALIGIGVWVRLSRRPRRRGGWCGIRLGRREPQVLRDRIRLGVRRWELFPEALDDASRRWVVGRHVLVHDSGDAVGDAGLRLADAAP